MAKISMKVSAARKRKAVEIAKANGRKAKMAVRAFNSCGRCGRTKGYIRYFGMCRICVREMARRGEIPGLRKASW